MNYALIDECEFVNGNGCGVSLYVSGCHFHCKDCFNSVAWDFDYGCEFDEKSLMKLFDALSKQKIKRLSILGGEPLADENSETVEYIINKAKEKFPKLKIWLWTGYEYEDIFKIRFKPGRYERARKRISLLCDYVVDGKFVNEQKDLSLMFKGSKNQRVIDMKKTRKLLSLALGKIITLEKEE